MIRTFVFVSGAILMALEMVASRFLAPQYGNSIVVWASLISVFLAGLSIGYWLGGTFADRWPSLHGVVAVLLVAAGCVLAIPIAARLVFAIAPSDVRGGSLVTSTLLFLAPTVLMGSVSPYAIRLDAADRERLGRSSGTLYAISTCGSIFGTIVTAFWLIPFAGIDNLTYLLGAALAALAAAVAIAAGAKARVLRIAVTAGGAAALLAGVVVVASDSAAWRMRGSSKSDTNVVYVHDSFYHHIVVSDSHGIRSLKFDDYVQSAMSIHDPLEGHTDYTDHLHLGVALAHPRDVLMIGLGGGTLVKQFLHDYPGVHIDVAEIDPEVVEVARRFFAVPVGDPRLNIATEDGRRFLQRSISRKYDLIVLDAFNWYSVPFHLVTREFFELCRERLKPGGYLEMNFITRSGREANEALASVSDTLSSTFSEQYAFTRDTKSRFRHNWILVAGSGPQMPDTQLFATIAAANDVKAGYRALAAHLVPSGPDRAGGKVLTDQFAPIEEMMR
jgi:spermidine synthase